MDETTICERGADSNFSMDTALTVSSQGRSEHLWVTFIKQPYMKLLGGGVSMGDTTRNKQTTTDHFLGGRNPRLIPF